MHILRHCSVPVAKLFYWCLENQSICLKRYENPLCKSNFLQKQFKRQDKLSGNYMDSTVKLDWHQKQLFVPVGNKFKKPSEVNSHYMGIKKDI